MALKYTRAMHTNNKSGVIMAKAKNKIRMARAYNNTLLKRGRTFTIVIRQSNWIIVIKPMTIDNNFTARSGVIPAARNGMSSHENNGAQYPFIASWN
jgi:hypothetical protein